VEIKTKKHFNDILKQLTLEIVEEDELEEITTSAEAGAYSTPFAFDPEGEKKKKKFKSNSYRKKIDEKLEKDDIEVIKKLIRDVISDVYRDIWIKRNSWK
jgi:hypothetical protein